MGPQKWGHLWDEDHCVQINEVKLDVEGTENRPKWPLFCFENCGIQIREFEDVFKPSLARGKILIDTV